MKEHSLHLAILSLLITLCGCGSGDSASATAPAGENKSMSPAEVQKELEKISPPVSGKATAKKK